MTQLTRTGMVNAVFLVGCAVGGTSSQFIVPKANAQNVQRWDYLCFDNKYVSVNESDEALVAARKAGKEGWELVGFGGGGMSKWVTWCFKRPM